MKIYDKKLLLIALICLIGTVWQGWYLMQNRGKFDFVLLIMFILGVCIYLRGALTKQGYEDFQRQRAKENLPIEYGRVSFGVAWAGWYLAELL